MSFQEIMPIKDNGSSVFSAHRSKTYGGVSICQMNPLVSG